MRAAIKDNNDASSNMSKFMDSMVKWLDKITTPEFLEFQKERIAHVLADGLDRNSLLTKQTFEDFKFPDQIEKQHDLVTSFFHLHSAAEALNQCQYYFRRYPFKEDKITRADHARNMCEFYLSNIYVLRSRLKIVLNNMIQACPELQVQCLCHSQSF